MTYYIHSAPDDTFTACDVGCCVVGVDYELMAQERGGRAHEVHVRPMYEVLPVFHLLEYCDAASWPDPTPGRGIRPVVVDGKELE